MAAICLRDLSKTQGFKMLGELDTTHAGFEIVNLTDASGVMCSIQQSSACADTEYAYDHPGSSFLWIGVDDPEPKVMRSQAASVGLCVPAGEEVSGWMSYPIPPQVLLSTRMHLNKDQVSGLVRRLQAWLATGSLVVADR
jgi:hypothetical protein